MLPLRVFAGGLIPLTDLSRYLLPGSSRASAAHPIAASCMNRTWLDMRLVCVVSRETASDRPQAKAGE